MPPGLSLEPLRAPNVSSYKRFVSSPFAPIAVERL